MAIVEQIGSAPVGSGGDCTVLQLKRWAAANGAPKYIYTLDNAVDADVANANRINWFDALTMTEGDVLSEWARTKLGFTTPDWHNAIIAMKGY